MEEVSLSEKYSALCKQYEKAMINNSKYQLSIQLKDQIIEKFCKEIQLANEIPISAKHLIDSSIKGTIDDLQYKFEKSTDLINKYIGIIQDLYSIIERLTGKTADRSILNKLSIDKVCHINIGKS